MKRLFICALAAALSLLFISCKDTRPDFGYILDIQGDVQEAKYANTIEFTAKAYNLEPNDSMIMNKKDAVIKSITENPEASSWIDNQAAAIIANTVSTTAFYTVTIRGMVIERNTGLLFSVDKTFTNDTIQ